MDAPKFGRAQRVYNVIDSRQIYPQMVVKHGLRALDFNEEAEQSHPFRLRRGGADAACAREMGYTISEEDAQPAIR